MAKMESSPAKNLVQDTYRPRIAMLCSPAAQTLCEKNNLKFTQLVQPFSALTTDLSWQEPSSQYISPRGLRIRPVDLSVWKPPEQDSQKNRRILNSVVSQAPPPLPIITEDQGSQLFQYLQLNGRSYSYSLQVPKCTPWFEAWRETFLKFHSEQQQSQHEFLNQFIACVLVISASEGKTSEELTTILGKLSNLQFQHQHEWPQAWFLPSVLKFYLIVHDNSTDNIASSESAYQNLRTTYGGNSCYMLKINSNDSGTEEPEIVSDVWSYYINQEIQSRRDAVVETSAVLDEIEPVDPDEPFHPLSPSSEYPPGLQTTNGEIKGAMNENFVVRGRCLTTQDMQSVQIAVNEFIGKCLLPYVEGQAKVMYESILNRRGMSKSFFSATKRLFGTGTKTASSVVYPLESPEMLSRKLADLYFLFGHYEGAYQLYHQIKKDFQADSAWIYYASSLEMAALSHFMMTQAEPPMAVTRSFPVHYITEAINYYNDYCRMPDAANRCAIIFCECLKQMNNFGEAAAIFIRMTSEDCDLRSALMLEQAAYAFIKLSSPRKYALHSVLAGHRYAKAGLRTHSLNCYLQAFQIYGGRGWKFAEDHVQFTIARHQACLQIYGGLTKRLLSLLRTPTLQSVAQIQIFYKEFINIAAKLYEEEASLQEIFIPTLQCSNVRVLIASTDLPVGEISNIQSQDVVDINWDSLEEQVVKECIDPSVIIFKPSKLTFDSGTDNTVHPRVPCNETFYVEIPFHNPLSTELILRQISLKFDKLEEVKVSAVDCLNLQPCEAKTLRFAVSCCSKGMISFEWVCYELELGSVRVPFLQKIHLKGPRMNSTQSERNGRVYTKDLRNKINILGELPLLQAEVENLPSVLYHSQCTEFNLVLKDKSNDSKQRQRVTKVVLASENMSDCLEVRTPIPPTSTGELKLESVQKNYCPLRAVLDGSSTVRIPCLYKVPLVGDLTTLNILLLYEIKPGESDPPPSSSPFGSVLYRVIKVSIKIPLLSSLRFEHLFLKRSTIQTTVNLLKVQNLTKDKTIAIEQIEYDSKLITIEDVTWKNNSDAENKSALQLEPTQSCNAILRTRVLNSINSNVSDDAKLQYNLCIKWKVVQDATDKNVENNNDFKLVGFHRLAISKSDLFPPREESPLIFQLRHVSHNKHDFSESPCFICPVELQLSCQKPGKLILKIERDTKKSAELAAQNSYNTSSQSVYFVGKTSWTINVESVKTQKLIYNVALTRPGIYNIAPVISVKSPDDGTHHTYDLHSPFIIHQA